MNPPSRGTHWHHDALLLLALVLLQAPLWLNPGYFSHDELQWASRAALPLAEVQFLSFTDWTSFQFRPLTFNLWLLLSHVLFETPRLFHAVFVLLGSLNALLLANVLRRAGAGVRVAAVAALVFALSPFAVWVHGWVGCLADLIWVAAGLGTLALLQRLGNSAGAMLLAAAGAGLMTLLGLLAKEAALVLPALLALGALLLRLPHNWMAATAGSGLVALAYLALRLDVLLQPEPGSTYTTDPLALPVRWLEYQVFPWALNVGEVHVLALASVGRWAVMVALLLMLAWCLWRASRRLWLAWFAGGVLALGPVLLLPMSANQYGYGFIALVCGVLALAWPHFSRRQGWVVGVLAAMTLLHGVQIQGRLLQAGRVQAVFSPALAAALEAAGPQQSLSLWPQQSKQVYLYVRMTHDIPSYRGVPIGDRVRMAARIEDATHLIAPDGSLHPMESPP